MKVLMINSVAGIRSTGRICSDIADVLKENGHECRIAYGRASAAERYEDICVKTDSSVGVLLHTMQARLFDNVGFSRGHATKRLIRWIKQYDPDVIHLHNLHGYYINIEVLFQYLKSSKKPVIWTLHDCWAFTGHCAHFDHVGCDKWKTQCGNCPQKRSYPSSLLLDNSARNYRKKQKLFGAVEGMTIVTPSKWLAGLVKQSFLKEQTVEVIPNGIDLSQFRPTPSKFRDSYGLQNKKIVLGVATSWSESKGLYDFYRLADTLDSSYQIVLVGVTEQQKQALPKNIIGIARTNCIKELAEIYSAADVFVNPSVQETMGLTTVEALACGTPVVVYDRTAVPETVEGTSCGTIVHAGDIEALALAIKSVDVDSDACVEQAKKYDKQAKYAQYLELYLKCVNEG